MGDSNVIQEGSEGSGQPGSQGPGQGHKRHKWHFHFSEEERRVFAECKRDSLMYRALPLATLFGALTYVAVTKGYLKPNARFGAIPKVTLAAILGYGIGKVSYRKVCMQKMMELPDSKLGEFLKSRQGRNGPWGGFPCRESMMMVGVGASPRDYYWGCNSLPTDKASTPEKTDA